MENFKLASGLFLALVLLLQFLPNSQAWSTARTIDASDTTNNSPSVAVFNGTLYIAWKGTNPNGGNIYYSSTSDGLNWAAATRINPYDATAAAPSLAVFNNRLFIAWKGLNPSGGNLWYSSTADGFTWSYPVSLINPSSVTVAAPSLAVLNDALFISWVDPVSLAIANIYYSSTTDGATWTPPTLVQHPGHYDFTKGTAALTAFNNALYIAYSLYIPPSGSSPGGFPSGNIYFAASSGSGFGLAWPLATQINSFDSTQLGLSMTVFNNKLYVSWMTSNTVGSNLYYAATSDGSTWGLSSRIATDATLAAPSLVAFKNNLYMFWMGANPNGPNLYYSYTSTP